MRHLIYFDIRSNIKIIRYILLIIGLSFFVSFETTAPVYILHFGVMVSDYFISEGKIKWDERKLTLPIRDEDIILSKYILISLLNLLVLSIIYYIKYLIFHDSIYRLLHYFMFNLGIIFAYEGSVIPFIIRAKIFKKEYNNIYELLLQYLLFTFIYIVRIAFAYDGKEVYYGYIDLIIGLIIYMISYFYSLRLYKERG